ncbi:hypothetical protein OAG16_03310 [Saprospiraceae bacterium]|nr:hypothetical protein [Saprospiraceae bacterium]
MGKFYVYAHVDKETQTPFYIGIGQGKRAFDKSRNDFWKMFVSKYAKDYEVNFIAENIDEGTAREIENQLIKRFGKIQTGNGILLNWTDGGYGEGVFIQLSFEDNSNELTNRMTEFGKMLNSKDVKEFNVEKIHLFLNEILEDKSRELREKTITEIEKKVKPRNSLTVPFCVTESIKKSDTFTLNLTDLETLKRIAEEPIKWENLPYREYVDFLIHRIMIHFDLILQENVILERNGKRISKADSDWYFYKDYWKGYVKIIQAKNRGLEFEIKYVGRNKKDRNRKDIHDFEIEFK